MVNLCAVSRYDACDYILQASEDYMCSACLTMEKEVILAIRLEEQVSLQHGQTIQGCVFLAGILLGIWTGYVQVLVGKKQKLRDFFVFAYLA